MRLRSLLPFWQVHCHISLIEHPLSCANLPRLITPGNALFAKRSIRRIVEQIVPGRDLATLTFADHAIPRTGNATHSMQGVSTTCDDGPLFPPS